MGTAMETAYNAYVGTAAAKGPGYGCWHMSHDDTDFGCVVAMPGYQISSTDGSLSQKGTNDPQIAYCLREVTENSVTRCKECDVGYVANSDGTSCRYLNTQTVLYSTDAQGNEVRTVFSSTDVSRDKKLIGCRAEGADNKCLECKEGYYQGYLKHNDHCMEDSMFHCHKFSGNVADRDSCSCRYDSLQADRTNNNHCVNTAYDNIVEDRVWKNQVAQNNFVHTDNCHRLQALRIFMCDEGNVNGDSNNPMTGLKTISDAYIATQAGNTQVPGTTDWKTYQSLVEDQMPKIMAAWVALGVDNSDAAGGFCAMTVPPPQPEVVPVVDTQNVGEIVTTDGEADKPVVEAEGLTPGEDAGTE